LSGLGLRRIGDVRVTADNRQELEHDRAELSRHSANASFGMSG
jgi:hypothetical protein